MQRYINMEPQKETGRSVARFVSLFLVAAGVLNGTSGVSLRTYAAEAGAPNRDADATLVATNPVVSKDFYSQLSPLEKEIYDELKASVYDSSATIDLSSNPSIFTSKVSVQPLDKMLQVSANKAFDALRYDYPDYFWLSKINVKEIDSEVSEDGQVAVSKVDINLLNSAIEDINQEAETNAALHQIISSVEGSTRAEKLESLYVTVGLWMSYNYGLEGQSYTSSEVLHSQQITSALIDRYTVCTGYAKTFKLAAEALGIPCITVSGIGYANANPQVHMWNMVQLEDGKWYAVDATWDDVGDGTINDDYFLVGADTIVPGGSTFEDTHRPDHGLFSPQNYGFSYPTLSNERYEEPKGRLYPVVNPF